MRKGGRSRRAPARHRPLYAALPELCRAHPQGPVLVLSRAEPCARTVFEGRTSPTPASPSASREDNGWLVRFYYYRERISVEVFHALSDGGGAIVFFRTLLAEYLRQTGVDVPAGNGVLDLNEPPREEELEDAYARYAGRARLRPAPPAEGLSEYRHAGAVLHLPCHDGLRAALPPARAGKEA